MLLVADRTRDGWCVQFAAAAPPLPCGTLHRRVSPLFPVQDGARGPSGATRWHAAFLFLDHPASTIGELLGTLNDERTNALWYSHGLASVVVLSDAQATIEDVVSTVRPHLNAYEIWTIDEMSLVDSRFEVLRAGICPPLEEIIPSRVTPSLSALLFEYERLLETALLSASVYYPDHVRVLVGVNHALAEALNAPHAPGTSCDHSDTLPPSNFADVSVEDQVTQVTSALSYLVTQYYAGTLPILEHPCPVGSFALLGTGAAAIGLAKLYENASLVFARFPIPRVIYQDYAVDLSCLPVFRNAALYKPDAWLRWRLLLDQKLSFVAPAEWDQACHVMHFSGRLGFRESRFSVTAALHALFLGATSQWNLGTVTHELAHAHVRALLAVILPDEVLLEPDSLWSKFQAVDDATSSETVTLRDRLGFIVLAACEEIETQESVASEILKGKSGELRPRKYPNGEELVGGLKRKYKTINEHLAHALDYLYFYNADSELYIQSIWQTWVHIPDVGHRVWDYVLRTLVTVAISLKGNIPHRFDQAAILVSRQLTALQSRSSEAVRLVLAGAIELLGETSDLTSPKAAIPTGEQAASLSRSALLAEFTARIRLADMACYLLFSSKVHRELVSDPLYSTSGEARARYAISRGEFLSEDIASPVAFLLDRARARTSEVASDEGLWDLIQLTCWEFLLLASAQIGRDE